MKDSKFIGGFSGSHSTKNELASDSQLVLLLMIVNSMKTFRKSFHQLKNIHYLCIR